MHATGDAGLPELDLRFAVLAEKADYDASLYLQDLTFARLVDDVVVPYESNEAFFIDGVPVTRKELRRIKIVRQSKGFTSAFNALHHRVRKPSKDNRIDETAYPAQLDALFRGEAEDVTAQIIKAFDAKIRPHLQNYLPKREQLVSAAFQVFIAGMKLLNSGLGASDHHPGPR